jgi:NTE family protein
MTTAFVLWGAASLGAAHVGMLRALTASGIRPDVVVGASSGAINGVGYAAHPDEHGVEHLAREWERISRHDVYPLTVADSLRALVEHLPTRPLHGVLQAFGAANHAFPFNPLTLAAAMLGRRNHLIDSSHFKLFLENVLPVHNLEDTTVPVEVLTTDLHSGESVPFASGPAVPAVMASAAIPAVYPAVEYAGHTLVDGEVANGTSLDRAVELGADDIYLLAPSVNYQLSNAPSSVLGMAVQAYNMLSEQRLAASIEHVRSGVRLHRLPSPNAVEVTPVDLTHTIELIEQAEQVATAWLQTPKRLAKRAR